MKYTNKHILPNSLLALLIIALFASGSFATPIDQSQETFTGLTTVWSSFDIAQTFTPSATRQMDYVDLYVTDKVGPAGPRNPHYPATISILQTGVGGAPTGALLGQVNVTGFVADTDYDWDGDGTSDFRVGWNSIDFSSQSISLNANVMYAIVITNNDLVWNDSPTDTFLVNYGKRGGSSDPLVDSYTGGILWERDRSVDPAANWQQATIAGYPIGYADLAFRTHMIPEPTLTTAPLSGSSLNFGSLLSSDPDPTLVSALTLSNTGENSSTINVLSAVWGGADPGLFGISLGDVPTTLTVGVDAWEAYDLRFLNLGTSGLYSASLTFNTSEGSVLYNLNAEVIPDPEPTLTASPLSGSSLDFGSLLTSDPDPTLVSALTLSNTGDNGSTINVLSAVWGGDDPGLFDITLGDVPTTLTVGADALEAYDLSFLNPGTLGIYSASLTFNTSEGFVLYNLNAEVVPEPATLLPLLGAALFLLLIRRRTHRPRILCVASVQPETRRILRDTWKETKIMKRPTPFLTLLFALAFTLPADISKADTIDSYRYDLEIFTSNGSYYNDPGVDLYVEVSLQEEAGQPDRVRFEFHNDSTMYCSLADIYFDDGTLSELVSIDHGPGTSFSQWATPGNLPDAGILTPPFQTSLGFSADSDAPPPHNGVESVQGSDPQQWVAIIFDLEDGAGLDSVLNDLNTQELRIGVRVQSFPQGPGESAVTVPEPTTLVLLAMTAGIAVFCRRSKP